MMGKKGRRTEIIQADTKKKFQMTRKRAECDVIDQTHHEQMQLSCTFYEMISFMKRLAEFLL